MARSDGSGSRHAALRGWSLALLLACACSVNNAGLGSDAARAGGGPTGGAAGSSGVAGGAGAGRGGSGGDGSGTAGVAGTAGEGGAGGSGLGGNVVPSGGVGGDATGGTAGFGDAGAAGSGAAGGAGGAGGGSSGAAGSATGGASGSGAAGAAGGAAGTGAAGTAGTGAAGAGGEGAVGGAAGSAGAAGAGGSFGGRGGTGFGGRGGFGGSGFCGGCPACMRCVNGACSVDPTSLWKVGCVRAAIAETKPSGDPWDTGIGSATAPDPLCAFWFGNSSAAQTSVLMNTFAPAWNESITPTSRFTGALLSSQSTPWSIRVTDEDTLGADTVCSVSPTFDAAVFSSGTATYSAGSCTTLVIDVECVSQ